jgi:predicted MFS family arabinose efflux permease
MDVPARQALVMNLVPPEEQAAAAAVTNVPRSLAAAVAPLLAGALLEAGWLAAPLVLGGALKLAYDGLLLLGFRRIEA